MSRWTSEAFAFAPSDANLHGARETADRLMLIYACRRDNMAALAQFLRVY